MNEKENILLNNIDEYILFADMAYKKEKYNTATTLFFKAIAALIDLHILKNEGYIPSSHSKRFRLLEKKYFDLYKIADRDFPFYQESYTNKINKEAATLLKKDAENLKKLLKVK